MGRSGTMVMVLGPRIWVRDLSISLFFNFLKLKLN